LDLEERATGFVVRPQAQPLILLDTNALIWLLAEHKRARKLPRGTRLYVSPVSLLELQFLDEVGRIRLRALPQAIENDGRYAVDDPSSVALFKAAYALAWTRDPFDRLIVGHARMRGWRIATSDTHMIDNLDASEVFEI
jgi:PIN domain nuclease of toxin-antitoxin system